MHISFFICAYKTLKQQVLNLDYPFIYQVVLMCIDISVYFRALSVAFVIQERKSIADGCRGKQFIIGET
jgi:hypothetical protein